MPKFTAQQLQDMATSFQTSGSSIAQDRIDAIRAGAHLTDPKIGKMQGQVFSLNNLAASFAVRAANVTLDDVATALTTIQSSTARANAALQGLANVDKALNIGASVLILANTIFTADYQQIAQAAKNVLDAANTPA